MISHLLGVDLAIYRETRWRAVEVLAPARRLTAWRQPDLALPYDGDDLVRVPPCTGS